MLQSSSVNRSHFFAAATAISAVGFLTVPGLAHAGPLFPLAPACSQYKFTPGEFSLTQSNGYAVKFGPASGQSIAGGAVATPPEPDGHYMSGDGSGSIEGRHLDFTISWHTGEQGHYWGNVGDDGFAHGQTVDQANPGTSASWDSRVPLVCADAPPAPAPPPPTPAPQPAPAPQQPAPALKVATVTGDVDVYDKPGGNGKIIGILRKGQPVTLVGSCAAEDWCHVATVPAQPGTPGNEIGFVWGHLQF